MQFEVTHQYNGSILDKFTVKARKAGLIGVYVNGECYLPDTDQVIMGVNYRLKKAILRNPLWYSFGLSDVVKIDLYRKADNAPMGTIFAKLINRE